eukprot:gnl/Dysnectes_brevis/423_a466_4748.p1 GENE.gnl/Dysnectes_brevis/423_a466_4748~~gnl/Dysnectes_brevis/423_a466_4748.p1  ORF type:complete len:684 (-),score=201.60 gnl/Dysnectes_brevis/423_a466_4748:32-2083(-)
MADYKIPEFVETRDRLFEELLRTSIESRSSDVHSIEVTIMRKKKGELQEVSKISVEAPLTALDVAKLQFRPKQVDSYILASINGEVKDLNATLLESCQILYLTRKDEEAKMVLRHSSAHLLGAALEIMYEGQMGHGPATDTGFFYDAKMDTNLDQDELPKITKTMVKLASQNSPFERLEVSRADALRLFESAPLKCQLIEMKVQEGDSCSVYRCGKFVDFCLGPHLPSTGLIRDFQIMNSSAAYFLGDAKRESMQRVKGVVFFTKSELKKYINMLEEAKKKDHRRIGAQQSLYMTHPYAPGCPFFMPAGTHIYHGLQDHVRSLYRSYGYDEVITPTTLNIELWKTSGHWQHYRDCMFSFKDGDVTMGQKPMNCPCHALMYAHTPHDITELPIRMADFGVLHRNELKGALSGLTRVIKFQQDDAHIFCTKDQIQEEIAGVLQFMRDCYEPFGFKTRVALSTRPEEGKIGEDSLWDTAEESLKAALISNGYEDYELKEGDGAFYGPKIDVQLCDAIGRWHQCATVQLDFNLPMRFKLKYYGQTEDGTVRAAEPVMIHRAILGSVERFMGILTEHVAGKWPFWLSPFQGRVISVMPDHNEYAMQVRERLFKAGFEVTADVSGDMLGKKVRKAKLDKVNFILVVGKEEAESDSVNVRHRSGDKQELMTVDDLIAKWTLYKHEKTPNK